MEMVASANPAALRNRSRANPISGTSMPIHRATYRIPVFRW